MQAYVKTDIGLVRKTNEDSYIFMPPHLFAVADGMGGHVAGEVASKLAVNAVNEYITANIGEAPVQTILEQAISVANSVVFSEARQNNNYSGMGTTLTVAYVDGQQLHWAHVGDSRLYAAYQGQLCQLTQDHSLVWELARSGTITVEEAEGHPQRNMLTRAVGASECVKVDTGCYDLKDGTTVLLCTDGLTNMVSTNDIAALMNCEQMDEQMLVDHLVKLANAAGGFDNITALLLKF